MRLLRKLADNQIKGSMADQFRERRMKLFKTLISIIPPPVKILDLGGTPDFWIKRGMTHPKMYDITIVNIKKQSSRRKNFHCIKANVLDLGDQPMHSYDVVFSNSLIEHLRDLGNQLYFSMIVKRLGKNYFIQTPNRHFPVEPHFLFPFWQYLPRNWRIWLVQHFSFGWYNKAKDGTEARAIIDEIRLLDEKQLRQLFYGATIYKERFMGLTKSFVAYDFSVALMDYMVEQKRAMREEWTGKECSTLAKKTAKAEVEKITGVSLEDLENV